MPDFCAVVGCSNRRDRDGAEIRFFRIPAELNFKHKLELNLLSKERRKRWIKALRRKDITESKLKYFSICSKHFISGKPADLQDRDNLDWIPSLHMTSTVPPVTYVTGRHRKIALEEDKIDDDVEEPNSDRLHSDNKCSNLDESITVKHESIPTNFLRGVTNERPLNYDIVVFTQPEKKHGLVDQKSKGVEDCELSLCDSSSTLSADDCYYPAVSITEVYHKTVSTEEIYDSSISNDSTKDLPEVNVPKTTMSSTPLRAECQYGKYNIDVPSKLDFSTPQRAKRHYQNIKDDNANLRNKMAVLKQRCKRMETKLYNYETLFASLKEKKYLSEKGIKIIELISKKNKRLKFF